MASSNNNVNCCTATEIAAFMCHYYKQYILNYTSYDLVTDIYIILEGKLSCILTVGNFLC